MIDRNLHLLTRQLDERIRQIHRVQQLQAEISAKQRTFANLLKELDQLEAKLGSTRSSAQISKETERKLHYCNEFFKRIGLECDCFELSPQELERKLKGVYKKYK